MCPLLSWEKVGIENKEYEEFKYLFSLIFDEKVWQNKYLGLLGDQTSYFD